MQRARVRRYAFCHISFCRKAFLEACFKVGANVARIISSCWRVLGHCWIEDESNYEISCTCETRNSPVQEWRGIEEFLPFRTKLISIRWFEDSNYFFWSVIFGGSGIRGVLRLRFSAVFCFPGCDTFKDGLHSVKILGRAVYPSASKLSNHREYLNKPPN